MKSEGAKWPNLAPFVAVAIFAAYPLIVASLLKHQMRLDIRGSEAVDPLCGNKTEPRTTKSPPGDE